MGINHKGFETILSLEKLDLQGNMLDGHLEDGFLLFSTASYCQFVIQDLCVLVFLVEDQLHQ